MSEDVVIRRATASDVERIVRLTNAGGPGGKPRKTLPDELPRTYWEAFKVIDSDPHQSLLVVELEGKVVGTFQLTFITYLAGAGKPDCQIEAIHVEEALRGKGIGTKMLGWAIELATKKNCRRVQLTTDKTRKDAHKLYTRAGFVFSHEGAKLIL